MKMDKSILKKIAKRWCKGILTANEAAISFNRTGLSDEEINYIQKESMKIANSITNLDASLSTTQLVRDYYDFE